MLYEKKRHYHQTKVSHFLLVFFATTSGFCLGYRLSQRKALRVIFLVSHDAHMTRTLTGMMVNEHVRFSDTAIKPPALSNSPQ